MDNAIEDAAFILERIDLRWSLYGGITTYGRNCEIERTGHARRRTRTVPGFR